MRHICTSVLVLAVVFPASLASGQNLVSNPTFDTDVAGWTPDGDATITWDPMDADNDPGSGSAMVANIANYSTTVGANQCSAVLEGDQEFSLGTMIYIPSGQSETGYGYVSIRFYDLPDCQGNLLISDFSTQVYTTTPDQWLESSRLLMAPPNSQSALVWLSIHKDGTGSLDMAFDNVSLFPIVIFADGFDDGDTSRWSITVP